MLAFAFTALLFSSQPQHDDGLVVLRGFDAGRPVPVVAEKLPIRDSSGNELFLRQDAAGSFTDLIKFAAREGVEIRVNYAFRTEEQQRGLRRSRATRRLAAKVGHSDHQRGISVDLAGTVSKPCRRCRARKTELYYWLAREAPRFGFINDVRGEPWHWTFISPEQASDALALEQHHEVGAGVGDTHRFPAEIAEGVDRSEGRGGADVGIGDEHGLVFPLGGLDERHVVLLGSIQDSDEVCYVG